MNTIRVLRAVLMVTLSVALALGVWGGMPAGKMAAAVAKTWDGGAGTANWNDAANWNNDTVPISTDNVLLDNSLATANYTVNLPEGATTVAIYRLTITPAPGRTITLVLPSGNTANPGLSVGDNVASTDDIILNDRAILQNASGATSGTGVAVISTSNGTFKINNGGHYIHNTTCGDMQLVSNLSTAAGTETGIFEYDVPASADYSPSAANHTYGTLILSRSGATAFSYTLGGANPVTIRGNLEIHSDATLDAGDFTGGISIGADWIIEADATGVVPTTNVPTVAGVVTNEGVLQQTLNVNAATVNFLTISTDKYRGVDITTAGNLGDVTVVVQGNADTCTTGAGAVNYVKRCFSITPENNLGATLTLWAIDDELNFVLNANLALYRYVAGWVKQLTNFSIGTASNEYNYVKADVTGFSSFLMGDANATPTAVTISGLSAASPFAALAVGLLAAVGLVVLRKRK